MSVFDGLPDIFTDTFGEPVSYMPVATGVARTISAIWWEASLDAALDGVDVDLSETKLHVRAADVPSPKEGDRAQRVSDSKVMLVSTPILPDGKGMIVCNLTT